MGRASKYDAMTSRTCKVCGETKPISSFHLRLVGKPWRSTTCKVCESKEMQGYGRANRKRLSAKTREWRTENRVNQRDTQRRYASKNRRYYTKATEARREQAAEVIDAYKCQPCDDCGQTLPPPVMDLDHVVGEKVAPVSMMKSFSRRRISGELAKTVPVCCNCHRTRTRTRRTVSDYRPGTYGKLVSQLRDVPCADCSKSFPRECMDFHHVKPSSKSFTVMSWGKRRVRPATKDAFFAEVEKCVVICGNCHRTRHFVKDKLVVKMRMEQQQQQEATSARQQVTGAEG